MANGGGLDGGERLPWLEAVENEDEELGGGFGRLMLVFVAVLGAIGLAVGGVVLLRHHNAATADVGGIIRAPAGPYKERPTDPGGMKVAGAGDVAYGTSTGQDIDSAIDMSAMPESPVAGPGSAPRDSAPVPPRPEPPKIVSSAPPAKTPPPPVAAKPAPKPAKAEPAEDQRTAAAPSTTIQLGAFSSEAKARAAWKSLSGRFEALGALSNSITEVESSNAPTLYRLRAVGPGAARICAALRVASETCSVVSG